MAFTFPKDEELFLDLDTVRVERATAEQDLEFHVYGDEECFGKSFRDIIKEWCSNSYYMRASSTTAKVVMVENNIREYHKNWKTRQINTRRKKQSVHFQKALCTH